MATAGDVISSALRLIGVLAAGEDLPAADGADSLSALNDLLRSWNTERSTIFEITRDVRTLVASTNPNTIGTGGNINATRPIKIERASIIESGQVIEYPLEIIETAEQWQAIPDKTQTASVPLKMWYEPEFPLGKLWFYPICSAANSVVLYTWSALGTLAALATDISFPPGYERMIRYNLAMDLAAEFGVTPSALVDRIATETRAAMKALNAPASLIKCDPGVLALGRSRRGINILTGE